MTNEALIVHKGATCNLVKTHVFEMRGVCKGYAILNFYCFFRKKLVNQINHFPRSKITSFVKI